MRILLVSVYLSIILCLDAAYEDDKLSYPADVEISVSAFHQNRARLLDESYTALPAPKKSELLFMMGRLALFARMHRMWLKQPRPRESKFLHSFPVVDIPQEILRPCLSSLKDCVTAIWKDVASRTSFLFSSAISESVYVSKEIARKQISMDFYEYDYSAFHMFCWMTMNKLDLMKRLPFCKTVEMQYESTDPKRNLITYQAFFWNEFDVTSLRDYDYEPFHCASNSFCVDPCKTYTNFCGSQTCQFISDFNHNFYGMLIDQWNATCSCENKGFIFTPDTQQCVDINECVYVDCGQNKLCVNTVGSYKCVCQLGYMLKGNKCRQIQFQRTKWYSPAIN